MFIRFRFYLCIVLFVFSTLDPPPEKESHKGEGAEKKSLGAFVEERVV